MERILRLIDENKLTVMMFNSHDRYIEPAKRWFAQIESNRDGEKIRVEKDGPTAEAALAAAWDSFERIALMGKPGVLAPMLEHRPLQEALDDHVPF